MSDPAGRHDHSASVTGTPARAVTETHLDLPGRIAGKVRDVYDLPPDGGGPLALLVATDRISAFDVVMPTPIPGKGVLLTEIAAFWLRWIESSGLARTHLVSTDVAVIEDAAFDGDPRLSSEDLAGRVTIGRRCRVLPVEFVVRGYLEGSGWRDYQSSGAVCGIELPSGLRQCERLAEPVFTPATKAERGAHDENISFDEAARLIDAEMGMGTAERLRDASLAIYRAASAHAEARGLILADTKFEFGVAPSGEVLLIDEALTPDSSRWWPADQYEPGRAQPSFDKQYVREHLQALVDAGAWDKAAPGPELPADVVAGTLERYRTARDLLLS